MALKARAMMYVQQVDKMPISIDDMEYRVSEKIKPEKWAYIVHDKDSDDEGAVIKAHVHLMMRFSNPRSIDSIAKKLSDEPQRLENMSKFGNPDSGFAYLVHATENSCEKYQYNSDDVVANFDFSNFIRERKAKSKVKNQGTIKARVNQVIDEMYAGLITKSEARIKIGNMGGSVLAMYDDKLEKAFNAKLKIEAEKWQENKIKNHEKKDIYWIFGESGTGKSSLAKKIAYERTDSVFVSGASNDPFQGYEQEEAVILDELRPSVFEYSDLLRMLDPYSFDATTKARYRNTYLTADTIIITSPFNPILFYKGYKASKTDSVNQLLRRISLVIRMTDSAFWELRLTPNDGYERNGEMFANPYARRGEKSSKLHLDDVLTPNELKILEYRGEN